MKRAASLITSVLTAAAVAAPAFAQTFQEQVVEIVNQERWNNGQLAPLKGCNELDNSASLHSQHMADRDFFAHCDLDTHESPWDRIIAAGYSYNAAGENIAAGYSTPAAVMTGWMNSAGHKANILNTNFREIGVGYFYASSDANNIRSDSNGDCTADGSLGGPYYRYWTQNFGKRSSIYPVVVEREAYETDQLDVALYVYGAGFATEMRFSNDNANWSGWESYAADKSWQLDGPDGVKTVYCQIRNGTGSVKSAEDSIVLTGGHTGTTGIPSQGGIAGLIVRGAAPNPFRANTTLQFDLKDAAFVRVTVFDITGRAVGTLAARDFSAGTSALVWDGRGVDGVRQPDGMYFIRVDGPGVQKTVKAILQR